MLCCAAPRWLRRLTRRALLVAAVAVTLTACTATSAEQQVPLGAASFYPLASGAELGQSFVVHHAGLAGVELFLQPDTPGTGTLRAELRASVDGPPLATASLPIAAVTEPRLYAFRFAAPLASRQRDYYLALSVAGGGAVQAAVMPGDAYRDGSLYVAGRPAEGQLVYGQIFATGPRLLGYAARLATYLAMILAGLLVCVIPGLGLLAALDLPDQRRSVAERIALAVGISMAMLTVLLVWAQLLGLRLGPWNIWLLVSLGAALLAWRARHLRLPALRAWRPRGDRLDLALLALLLLIVLVRLVVVGSLDAPMWGDSYQHAMITQLMLDNGGLFNDWAPYEHYVTLTVQFGFSAVAAALAWATGISAVDATILAGQLLNAAAALTLYPLALRLAGGRRWAGVVAVLTAGLLAPLPGIYVNWGRYAQLAGQVVLPVAMALTWDLVAAPRRGWRPALLLGLVVAGMTLCYYRMAFFYVAFVGVLLLCWALPTWRLSWRAWGAGLGWLALAGAATALFFAPWAVHVSSSQLAATIGEAAALGTPLEYVQADYRAWTLLPTYMPLPLLVASAIAVLWALVRRAWMLPGLLLWTLLLSGYMATSLYGVPGAVMLQSFSVLIAVYIPVALACGWLAAELVDGLAGRPTTDDRRQGGRFAAIGYRLERFAPLRPAIGYHTVPFVGLAVLALWGGLQQLRIVDPAFIIVTRPDVKAMRWIAAETPPTARFLVHGFDVYGGTSVVGADGGWWIPLLAGRSNTMPPQYAIANERAEPPDYTKRVVALVHDLRAAPPTTPEGMQILCAEGITYLYHGQGQGRVGATAAPLFTPAELDASPNFTLRYAQDRVAIYSFDRQVCPVAVAP